MPRAPTRVARCRAWEGAATARSGGCGRRIRRGTSSCGTAEKSARDGWRPRTSSSSRWTNRPQVGGGTPRAIARKESSAARRPLSFPKKNRMAAVQGRAPGRKDGWVRAVRCDRCARASPISRNDARRREDAGGRRSHSASPRRRGFVAAPVPTRTTRRPSSGGPDGSPSRGAGRGGRQTRRATPAAPAESPPPTRQSGRRGIPRSCATPG